MIVLPVVYDSVATVFDSVATIVCDSVATGVLGQLKVCHVTPGFTPPITRRPRTACLSVCLSVSVRLCVFPILFARRWVRMGRGGEGGSWECLSKGLGRF